LKTRLSRVVILLAGLGFLLSSSVSADTTRVISNSDYWFTFGEQTWFTARTHYIQGIGSDPHLWLYNADNELITANDDWFGLQSYIQADLPAGQYRLRAGICCGDPNRWWQGVEYDLEVNTALSTTSTQSTETSTTLPPTTTSVPPTTTTSTSTISTTTTTSTVPPTSTTEPPPPTTTSPPETTTTSVAPIVPPSTSTIPPSTSSSTSTTTSSTSTTVPVTTTTTTTVQQTSTTVEVTPEPTPAEAAAIATNPEQVATLTADEAEAVFQALDVDTLTEDQIIELVAAVQDAPPEVREAFEEEVDIFSGATDTYVPLGSVVPVGTRRALIVITTVTTIAAIGATRRW